MSDKTEKTAQKTNVTVDAEMSLVGNYKTCPCKTAKRLIAEHDRVLAENKRLRDALRWIATSDTNGYTTGEGHSNCVWKAREALEDKNESISRVRI